MRGTKCRKKSTDASSYQHYKMGKTDLEIYTASINSLDGRKISELRKLWVHGVAADTNAVGWLPKSVFDSRAATNDVLAVYRDGDLVGWLLKGQSKARQVLKIYQIWVRPDARVLEHGRALIRELERDARRKKCWYLEAWVAEDLPANLFWNAMGFTRNVWRWGRGQSLRKIYRWIRVAGNGRSTNATIPEFSGVEAYVPEQRRHSQHGGTFQTMAEVGGSAS